MSSNYKKAVCAGSVLMLIATGFFVSPAVKADVAAIPPADIVDLAVSAVASNSAQLSWSAPGADGFVEPATSYDMRRSTSSFNSALWNTLPQVAGMPTPGQPGALQSFALTGLNPGTTYFVAVRGVDSFGVLSRAFNVVSFTTSAPPDIIAPPDITAPSVPANLTATAVSSGQVNLAWIASVDATGVTGYKVFRNTVQVATSTAVSFNDTGLTPSTTYAYAVSAFDAAGNGSAASAVATATTASSTPPDITAPSVPVNLTATAVSSGQVNLAWIASVDAVGVTGYKVFRNTVQVATSTAVSFNDAGLAPSTTYAYAVSAFDAAGNGSATSTTATATTASSTPPDITAPSVPANLTATAVSSGQVNLAWIASVDAVGVTGYKVFRNTVQVATSTAVSFNDAGLAPSTTYAYAVSAFDAAGNGSAASATATATTVPISNLISNVVFAPALQAIAAPSGKSFVFSILPAGQTTGGVGFTATADVNGRVAMPATVLLAPGSYDILVSSPTYLRKKLFAHNLSSNAIVALPALPAGDLDLNNTVNSLDWSLMSQRWLTADANADFNKDGIVNSIDWSIMSKNWFQTGN